jgi:hypothetical protein
MRILSILVIISIFCSVSLADRGRPEGRPTFNNPHYRTPMHNFHPQYSSHFRSSPYLRGPIHYRPYCPTYTYTVPSYTYAVPSYNIYYETQTYWPAPVYVSPPVYVRPTTTFGFSFGFAH